MFDSLIFYRIVSLIYSFLLCRYLLNSLLDGFLIFSQEHISVALYRGYYTAARRYEISLRVSKNISRMRAVKEKRNFLSPSDRVMFFSDLIYEHQWNNESFNFRCQRCDLLCENNILFSCVKISSFRANAHLMLM